MSKYRIEMVDEYHDTRTFIDEQIYTDRDAVCRQIDKYNSNFEGEDVYFMFKEVE